MSKKERIRLLIGVIVMILLFCAIASIGWTQDEFIITYYYGFDGKYETDTVKKGFQRNPLDPGRYGYLFDGWYYFDREGNEVLFDFETERVTRNLKLTAHWKPYETEIRLYYYVFEDYVFEETVHLDPVIVKYGEEYDLPTVDLDGLYFAGWQSLYENRIYTSGVWDLPVAEFGLRGRFSKFNLETTYYLGEYEQDNYHENGKEKIEWIPIDKKDGKYLLVSKYSLDAVSLHNENKRLAYIPWAECSLREWLNTEFYVSVFTDEEKLLIQDSYDAELGTTDKVFLLSRDEAELLIGFDEYGAGTAYALSAGLKSTNSMSNGYSKWLTRSCDNDSNWDTSGTVSPRSILGLRPAIWVDAEKLLKNN